MKHDRAMATLNIAAAALSKRKKSRSSKIIRRSQKIRRSRNDGGSNKNDERPIENAFYAKTHA